MVWGIKMVDILKNVLLFWLIFCLFRLFRNTKTPCFDIKAKQPKQTSCFGQCRNQFRLFRYETGFGGHPTVHFFYFTEAISHEMTKGYNKNIQILQAFLQPLVTQQSREREQETAGEVYLDLVPASHQGQVRLTTKS